MKQRRKHLAAAMVAVVLGAGSAVVMASAASGQVAANSVAFTFVQGLRGLAVDLYVNDILFSGTLGLGPNETLTGTTPAGADIEVFTHTTPPPALAPGVGSLAATILDDVGVSAPNRRTLILDSTLNDRFELIAYVDDLMVTSAGAARVSVRHTLASARGDLVAGDIIVYVGDVEVGPLQPRQEATIVVPPGQYRVRAYAANAGPPDWPSLLESVVDVPPDSFVGVYTSDGAPGTPEDGAFVAMPPQPIPSYFKAVNALPQTLDIYLNELGQPSRTSTSGWASQQVVGPFYLLGATAIEIFDTGADPNTARPVFSGGGTIGPNTVQCDVLSPGIGGANQLVNLGRTASFCDVSHAGVGNARVGVFHAAVAPTVTVCADGAPLTSLAPGESSASVVAGGTYAVSLAAAGEDCATATPLLAPRPLTLAPGRLWQIIATGSMAAETLDLLVLSEDLEGFFNPVTPTRIADTRDGTGGVRAERLAPGQVLRVRPAEYSDVPEGTAAAVAVNVTASEPADDGYLTVYACGQPAPVTSNVNYVGGQLAKPGVVISALQYSTGDLCITTYAEVDVIVDVSGWFRPGPGFTAVTSRRLADTRDGTGVEARRSLEPGVVLEVEITDDATVGGAALNVTVAEAGERGYLTVFPCADEPYASHVNFEAGIPASNAVLTDLDADGRVCITTSTSAHVVVDVAGLFVEDSAFVGTVPTRVADTRDGSGGATAAPLAPSEVLEVQVTGRGEIPLTGVDAVTLNVTATEGESSGYLTVFPCGSAPPYASNVNHSSTELSAANAIITGVSDAGSVCITSHAPVDVVVDLTGYFAA